VPHQDSRSHADRAEVTHYSWLVNLWFGILAWISNAPSRSAGIDPPTCDNQHRPRRTVGLDIIASIECGPVASSGLSSASAKGFFMGRGCDLNADH
jgi:hypothetical protein